MIFNHFVFNVIFLTIGVRKCYILYTKMITSFYWTVYTHESPVTWCIVGVTEGRSKVILKAGTTTNF